MPEMEVSKIESGERHPETLAIMFNLASIYQNQGRFEEAEKLEVQLVKIQKKELGESHPDPLSSLAKLSSTYMNQGRWNEAEELRVQVVEMRNRLHG